MPIYTVKAPNGKIYEINAPEGASQEDVYGYVQQQVDQEEIDRERRSQTGLIETGTRAVKRGFQELGATATDIIPAAIGSALGFEDYAKEQLKEAEKKREGWEAEAPTLFKSYKDVEGIGDFSKFVVETLGGQVANIGTALIPGIGGGVLAGRMAAAPVARAITADAVKKGLTKEATEEAVKRGVQAAAPGFAGAVGTGQAAGAFLGSYALSAPEIFENIYQETGQLEPGAAAIFSTAAAALDSILPATLARQLTMPAKIGIVEKVLEKSGMDKGLLRSMTAGLLQAIPTEALTEGTQEAISIAAERFVDENPKVFGSKEWDRIMESAVRGAVAGGGFGVVGGGVEGLRARGEVARERELNEELERLRRIDEEEAKQVSPDQLKEQAYFDELNRQAGADQAGLRTDTERQTRIAEIEAELASLQASQAQMQLPGMEMGPATGLVTPPVPSKPGKEPKATQAEMFTAEGELTPQMEKAAVRDQKAAEKQQKEREAQFKKDQQELKARLEELAPPKNLVSLAKTPTQLQQTVLQAQQDLDKIAKKRGAPTPTAPAAPQVTTAPAPTAPAPITLESITKIDDPVAFGKLLGIGRTAKILRADGPLVGADLSKPEDAARVKATLVAYASGKPAVGAAEKIEALLQRPEFQGVPDAARTDIQAGGEGVGVSDQGVGGAAAAPVESVERGGVDVVGGNVSQPVGREAPQPGALETAPAPQAPAPQAEIPDEAKRILNRVDTQIDQLLTSRANETLDNEGLSREELPIKQYRGTDVHNALRVPRLLAEYERLRGKPEPRTVAVRDGIEQTLSAISPDVAQFIERFKQASPAQRQAVLAELNRSAMEQFDSAMRFIVGDIRETAAQQGVKPLRAKTEPRVEKAKRRGMMMKEAEVLLNDYAQKFEKKTGKKLFLPKYEGPVFNDVQRRLAESGDVNGLLRNLLDSIQDPAIKQVLRRLRSLNLKTKIKIGDPTGAMALPAQFKVTAAAFRNVFSGKVYETGNMHRMDLLPAEERNKPSGTMEAGFVGNDGKFYNRKEVANKINRADLIEDINQEVHSSNLLPREDVKTQRQLSAFRDWFGDSKVVDAQGKPLIVYHGTATDITEFHPYSWVSTDPKLASAYSGKAMMSPSGDFPLVYPLYASIQNPLRIDINANEKTTAAKLREMTGIDFNLGKYVDEVVDGIEQVWKVHTLINSSDFMQVAKRRGYDGIAIKEGEAETFVAFHPEQLKSAIGNRGTFDPTNPDIRYAQNKAGSYDPATDTITLDPTNGLNAHTFIHETLHAAISNVLENRSHPLTKQFEKFFVSIQDRLGAAYGATDLQEFAAELISNPSFQAVLKTIKAPKSENMFMRVIRSIAELFGFPKGTAFDRGLKFINDALDITNDVPATAAQRLFLGDGTNQSKVIREIAEAQPSLAGRTLEDTKNFLSNLKGRDLQQLAFGLLRLDNIRDIYRKQLPSIKNLLDALEKRMGTEERSIERATNNFNRFLKVQRKHPAAMRAMDELSIEISDAQVDVTAAQFIARVADPKMNQRQKDEFDAAEAQRKRDYIELKKKFNALPEDVQDVYRTIRKDYDEAFNRYRTILEQAAEGSPALIAQLREEFTLKQPLIGYVPYRRYGDFWVEFTDPDTDAPVAMAFESIRERELFIKNDLQGIAHQKYDKIDNIQFDQNRIPPTHFLNDVVTKLRKEGASDAQVNSVYQAYLAAFPAESIAKQFIKRKGTRGMEKDLIRNYNDLMVRWARKLANSEYSPQVDRALIQIAQEARASGDSVVGAAAQNIQAQSAFFHNPTFGTLVSAGTQLSYFEFMAGNISSALINLTSLPLMVYPLLTGKFGWGKAYGAMLAAGKTAINNWGESERYKALYDKLNDHGQLQHTMAREVLEARRVKTEEYTNLKGKVLNLLSIPFSVSERYNRGVTAIAAYDLALENGMTKEQALDYALETVKTAHTSGTIATGPRWMQTPLGRVFFTFKSFIWNSAYVIARAFHQAVKGESAEVREMARRQLLATYGMATVFAGTKGMPFYGAISVMAEMLNALFGDDDEPFDFDEFMRDVFGDFLHKGAVNALLNLEVANRAGLATDLIFRDDPRGVAENGYVLTAMQQAFGPVGSILVNSGRAVEMFKDGHIARALETASPSFYRNASKGVRYMLDGATTLKGDPIDEDINAWNTTMQLVGFSPADLSNRYEMISMAKGFERQVELRRRDALRLYDMAIRSGDTELLAEARERIREFNQAQPKYRITQDSLNRSQRAREAAEKELIYGIRFNKNLRGEIKERFFEDEEE